jgi:UDPglucose 6-dehydrogenase
MQRVAVVGTGYVGLTTGACLAELGTIVTCVDLDAAKIDLLRRGEVPFFEPGLAEVVARNTAARRLRFTTDYAAAIPDADVVFIAVPTPTTPTGRADLRYVGAAARTIGAHLRGHTVVATKSTVPIGTGDWVDTLLRRHAPPDATFALVSNPEFLAEGTAVHDFMEPDRIVLGTHDRAAADAVAGLYRGLRAPFIFTDLHTAEMIKYASNAMLATRVSFINEIATVCERLGADVRAVARGMGYDKRIGTAFLNAGLGYGGSCFPKDVRALAQMADDAGCQPQLLRAVMEINSDQRLAVAEKVRDSLGGSLRGARITLLGLAFKPNTDDMREAPSVDLARYFLDAGATVAAYDPRAMPTAHTLLGDRLCYHQSVYEAVAGADAVLLVTEWSEFRALDLQRVKHLMRGDVFVDGRNLYDGAALRALGFTYHGVGYGYATRPIPVDADDLFAATAAGPWRDGGERERPLDHTGMVTELQQPAGSDQHAVRAVA